MNSVFITGIPASGKSFIAKRIFAKTGLTHVDADTFRKEMRKDHKLKKWVNFYRNLNEEKYFTETDCRVQWDNLVKQSQMYWPTVSKKISDLLKKNNFIIEGVNLLPHLMAKKNKIDGVVLLGESEKIILERLKKESRWGKTIKLKKLEANAFTSCEARWYKKEAEKYGYKTFKSSAEAEKELLRMIRAG